MTALSMGLLSMLVPAMSSATEIAAVRVDGGVQSSDHTIVYSGSPALDLDTSKLLQNFGITGVPSSPENAPLCELKNQGDRTCDYIVDNEDLALYAADLGPLVEQTTSLGQMNFDFVAAQGDYLYIAAWNESTPSNPKFQLSSTFKRPDGSLLSPSLTVATKTDAATKVFWESCATGVTTGDTGAAEFFKDLRGDLIEAIPAQCSTDLVDLSNDNWTAVSTVGNDIYFAADTSYQHQAAVAQEEVVLFRHPIFAVDMNLTVRINEIDDLVYVTVDPIKVGSFQLDLQFDDRLDFVDIAEVLPYELPDVDPFIGPEDPGGAAGFVRDINGSANADAVLPLEMDIFRAVFRKRDPNEQNEDYTFRVFASPNDQVTVFNDVPIIARPGVDIAEGRFGPSTINPVFATSDQSNRVTGTTSPVDFNFDGFTTQADVNIACANGYDVEKVLQAGELIPDLNGDGQVDFGDVQVLERNYRQTGLTFFEGDLSCDGIVSPLDTRLLLLSVPPPQPLESDTPVEAVVIEGGDFILQPGILAEVLPGEVVNELTLQSVNGVLTPIRDPGGFAEIVVNTEHQITLRGQFTIEGQPQPLLFNAFELSRLAEFDVTVTAFTSDGLWISKQAVPLGDQLASTLLPEPATGTGFLFACLAMMGLRGRNRPRLVPAQSAAR